MRQEKEFIDKKQGTQKKGTEEKYHQAILDCSNEENINVSISQIALRYNLSPSGLSNQLRAHYPWVLEWRYKRQCAEGLNTYRQSGHISKSEECYQDAVKLYRESDLNVKEVADKCGCSYSGFRQHLLFYHRDLVSKKTQTRQSNRGQQIKGKRNGNNTLHCPQHETIRKYSEALDLYVNTHLTIPEICRREKVPYEGFSNYLRIWNRDLMLKRKGIEGVEDPTKVNIASYKHYLVSTAAKYREPINLLNSSDLSIAAVANIFGLNPETFRSYLKEHDPDLAASRGRRSIENKREHPVINECDL